MRRSLVLALTLAFGATLAAHAPAGAAVQVIRLGHAQVSEEPLWLMGTPGGIMPGQGKDYDLQLTMFRSSGDRMKAYEAGAVDCETSNPASLLVAVGSGLVDLTVVATISTQHQGGVVTSYLVRDDSGIKSAKDLKGKNIAINGYKSVNELLVRTAVRKAGLNPDRDVKFTLIGLPQGPDALRQGLVDMAMIDEPVKTIELRKGGVHVLFSYPDIVGGDQDQNILFCRNDFLKAHAPAVRAFLADYVATLKSYMADRRRADDFLTKGNYILPIPANEPLPPDFARPRDGRVNIESWRQIQDAMLKAGFLSSYIKLSTIIDNSYLPKSR